MKITKHYFKRLKKTQRNGKKFCVHGLEESTELKGTYHPKQYTDLKQTHQNPMSVFKEIEQNNHQICMEPQRTPNSQSDSKKKE